MSWLDYVPIASNIKGIADGNAKQALFGMGGKILDDITGVSGIKPTDTKQLEIDRARAVALSDSLAAEKAASHTDVPMVSSTDVAYGDPGSAFQVARPADVKLDPNAPQVAAPTLGANAAQASAAGVAAPNIDDQQGQQTRDQQGSAINLLQSAATGNAPSVAEQAYRQKQNDIANQQLGIAAGGRGNQRTFLKQQAMRGIAEGDRRANLDTGLIRAQEMATARGQLSGALSDVRGADTGLAVERARQGLSANTSTASNITGVSLANSGQQNTRDIARSAETIGVDTGNADRVQSRDFTGAAIAAANADRGLTADTTNIKAANDRTDLTSGRQLSTSVGNADRGVDVSKTNAANTIKGQEVTNTYKTGLGSQIVSSNNTASGITQKGIDVAQQDTAIKAKAQADELNAVTSGISKVAAAQTFDPNAPPPAPAPVRTMAAVPGVPAGDTPAVGSTQYAQTLNAPAPVGLSAALNQALPAAVANQGGMAAANGAAFANKPVAATDPNALAASLNADALRAKKAAAQPTVASQF